MELESTCNEHLADLHMDLRREQMPCLGRLDELKSDLKPNWDVNASRRMAADLCLIFVHWRQDSTAASRSFSSNKV